MIMKMIQVRVVIEYKEGDEAYYEYVPIVLPASLVDTLKTQACEGGGTNLVLRNGNLLWVEECWADIISSCGIDPYEMMEEE